MPRGSPGESCSSLPSQSLPDQDSAPTFRPRDQSGYIHTRPGSWGAVEGYEQGRGYEESALWVARVGN